MCDFKRDFIGESFCPSHTIMISSINWEIVNERNWSLRFDNKSLGKQNLNIHMMISKTNWNWNW